MCIEEQVMALFTAVNGYLDDVEIKDITKFEQDFLKFMKVSYPEIGKTIREKKAMDKDTEAALKKAINEFKDIFGSDKNGNHGEVR